MRRPIVRYGTIIIDIVVSPHTTHTLRTLQSCLHFLYAQGSACHDDKMTTAKTVKSCLLILELAISIFVFTIFYWLLKSCLPFSDTLLAATATTLSGLWFPHVAQRMVRQIFCTEQVDPREETERNESNNALRELQSKMYRGYRKEAYCSCKKNGTADSPVGTEDQCTFITDAKFLIDQSRLEEQGKVTVISLSYLAIFASVILQCSVRFFTLLHSITRLLRMRRKSPDGSLISFFDIPFTTGKYLSFGDRSFITSHFLDRWSCRNDQMPPDRNMNLRLQAVSFDQILINSSHLYGTMRCSRLGVSLGGIEFEMTVQFEQCRGTMQSHTKADTALQTSVHSITMSIRIESLYFSIFPSTYQVKARGLHLEGRVAFHTDNRLQTNETANLNGKHSIFGLGLSHEFSEVKMFRSTNKRHLAGSPFKSKIDQNTIISWNTMQSTLYVLETAKISSPHYQYNPSKKIVVFLMEAPAGNIVIHASPQSGANYRSKQASILIGHYAALDEGSHCCRFAIALDVQLMSHFIVATTWILRDITKSLWAISVSNCNDESCTHTKERSTPKQKPIDIVAFDASFCSYFYVPCNKQGVGAFYLTSSNTSFSWNNTADPKGFMANYVTQKHPVRLTNVNLHYRDQTCLDIILLDEMKMKIASPQVNESFPSSTAVSNVALSVEKYAVANAGHLVVRINDKTIKQFSQLNKAIETVIADAKLLNSLVIQSKDNMLLSKNQNSQSPSSTERTVSQIRLSCKCVDAVVELQPQYYNADDLTSSDNTRIRVALLQRKISAHLKYRDSKPAMHRYHSGIENKLPPPNHMFECELQQHQCASVDEFIISEFEVSVTFYPHATLPVIGEQTRHNLECTFYAQAQGLRLKLAASSNSQMTFTSVEKLHAYELVGPLFKTQIFSNTVRKDIFNNVMPSIEHGNTGWPMLCGYELDSKVDKMILILTCTGDFCRVEKHGKDLGEKQELVSIQLYKGAPDLHFYWSTILMWLQASCNERMQKAIAYVKESLFADAIKQGEYTSRTTQFCIRIDPNAPATFHIFLGKKTVMHTFVENGMELNLTMTKHKYHVSSPKPNILINAGRVLLSFNDTKTPTFVIGDIYFRNINRRATSEEIFEYERKREKATAIVKEIVTDWDGHPMKEILHLKMGQCTAKFHPNLFFGEVIG